MKTIIDKLIEGSITIDDAVAQIQALPRAKGGVFKTGSGPDGAYDWDGDGQSLARAFDQRKISGSDYAAIYAALS